MKYCAVEGDDQRQRELRRLFTADGFVLCEPEEADCVILPLPASMPVVYMDRLRPGTLVIGGRFNYFLLDELKKHGLLVYDYVLREDFASLNACATAEGAIQLVMEQTDRTVFGMKILIVGNGRIGRLLARKLRSLGADTAVSARKAEDFADIENAGHRILDTRELFNEVGEFDVIINTVPALVIDGVTIRAMNQNAFIIDLASQPGGVDFIAAENIGIRVIHALSLPGKVAPVSAAGYAYRSIRNIFAEVEENGE